MSAQGLPAHILALFTPRPPPQHLPPLVAKKPAKLTGCAEFVDFLPTEIPPKREPYETPLQRKQRKLAEKMEKHKEEQKKLIALYDPHKDANAQGDPWKTLFVARISYDTTEKKLKREFEVFGSIKRVRMVYDQKGKPRGYAFIEYEHERDLKNAYKQGDGKKIDSRRVMVDVERGRTVEGWLPRRLGGGRGPGRVGKPSKKKLKKMAALEALNKDKEKEKEKERKDDDKKEKDRDRRDGDRDRGDRRERDRDRDAGGEKKEKDRKEDRPEKTEKAEKGEKDKKEERPEKDEKKKDKKEDRPEKDEKVKDKEKSTKEKEKGGKDKDREKDREKDRKEDRGRGKEEKGDRKRDRSRSRDRDAKKAKKARD